MTTRKEIAIPSDLVLDYAFCNKNSTINSINECIRIAKGLGWEFEDASSTCLFFTKKSSFWFSHFKWLLWMLLIGFCGIYGIIGVLILWFFWEGLELNSKSMTVNKFTFDIINRD